MDLNTIIVDQIKNLSLAEEQRKAEAKRQTEAENQRKAAKEEIRLKEAEIQFEINKKVFEDSFIREIMAVIIEGINSPTNKDYFPLRERIFENIKVNPHSTLKNTSKYYLEKTFPFKGYCDYRLRLISNDDFNNPIILFLVENHQIIFFSPLFQYHGRSMMELSPNKELAAREIIEFLMTD